MTTPSAPLQTVVPGRLQRAQFRIMRIAMSLPATSAIGLMLIVLVGSAAAAKWYAQERKSVAQQALAATPTIPARPIATPAADDAPPLAATFPSANAFATAVGAAIPRHQMTLKEVSYAAEAAGVPGYLSLRATAKIQSSYGSLRDYLHDVAEQVPPLAIERLRCTRADAKATTLECDLVLAGQVRTLPHG